MNKCENVASVLRDWFVAMSPNQQRERENDGIFQPMVRLTDADKLAERILSVLAVPDGPSLTDQQVINLAAEVGNFALDCSRQWSELDSAREGLPESDRTQEDAENRRIIHAHANRFRAIFAKFSA